MQKSKKFTIITAYLKYIKTCLPNKSIKYLKITGRNFAFDEKLSVISTRNNSSRDSIRDKQIPLLTSPKFI